MGKRRAARERALQILFELEFNDTGPEAVLARHLRENPSAAEIRNMPRGWCAASSPGATRLTSLSRERPNTGGSPGWRLVDRNILRIAVFEMLDDRFLAPAIVINEAIEIVKRFSGEESALFINGVLDAIRKTLEKKKPPSEVRP